MMDFFIEPTLQSTKLTLSEVAVQIAEVLASLFHELGGVEIAKRIGWKIANSAHAPMDVLKTSHSIGGRHEAEAFRELLIPGSRNVGGFQITTDKGLLHLETQNDMHVVCGFIGLDANKGRLHIV